MIVRRPDEVPDPQVQKELEHLYEIFDDLVMSLYSYLDHLKPDLKEFAVFVSNQPPPWKIQRRKHMTERDFYFMIAPNTEFHQMFAIVRRYVSWHNYELVDSIVRRYGNPDLKLKMKNYREELANFEEHTSAEVLKNIEFAICQPDSVALLAILPDHHPNQLSVGDVSHLKHRISEEAGVKKHAIRTFQINESSVEIIFLVPMMLAPYIIVSCSSNASPILKTQGPLPKDIYERAVYRMFTEEVFSLMGKRIALPATQNSSGTSYNQQVSSSSSQVFRSRENSTTSELSRSFDYNPPAIDPAHIQVHHDKVIMNGDNAVICKAHFLNLPCAAKYIHPKLSEASPWQINNFRKGCKLLQNLCHPNLVAHLGQSNSSTFGPILLMELMDLSLKEFLETQNATLLPLHTQLDLCSDVASGLEYLHAKDIIHGNLTATNVLVKRGRAKICGTTSLQLNAPDMELSVGSGAAVSLPRRSFSCGIYDERIDCFSFGVLVIHVITRQMPQPLTKILEPDGLSISEIVRYATSLEKVDCKHPMHQLIIECLDDKPFLRPSAGKLCIKLSEMRRSTDYYCSKTATLVATELVNLQNHFLRSKIGNKKEENKQLQEELDEVKGKLDKQEELKATVDWENMQNTIAMLKRLNEDLEKKVAAASNEVDARKADVAKSAKEKEAMLGKIRELKTENADFKRQLELRTTV